MKVTVDREVCCGAGMCALTAPAVFDQDEDDGRVVLKDATPDAEHQKSVSDAALLCPSGAISIVDPC